MNEIKDGALFISDSHDNEIREGFYNFLQKIDKEEIKTSQLFLMGDMFDLLVGEISYTKKCYQKTINLIDKLSKKIQIIYFEGNHDFNLNTLFSNVTVIPIQKQPSLWKFKNFSLLLSHGDIYEDEAYLRYTKIIRNRYFLTLLNLLDLLLGYKISNSILTKQKNKFICKKDRFFYENIKQKIQKYDIGISKIDFVCEGHHHQNREFMFESFKYKNFSSFACDKSYYQISFTDKIVFKEVYVRG